MSKVPITIDVDRYVCSELQDLRKMYEHRDFSGMMASTERIQRHVTAMEEGLNSNKYSDFYHNTDWILDSEFDDTDKLKKIESHFDKVKGDKERENV